jgi:hypothetical protein
MNNSNFGVGHARSGIFNKAFACGEKASPRLADLPLL